ncbi:hypothetical protein [Nocardia araoensis]|uniref:hypothetical protein n=1 Tax=Nocardia araoensis TaxID=228600 RepID=UPI00058496EE|nr:hypothetical protein [Nocardia araoensis]
MTVSWQGKSIDTLLDEGSAGLQYWIQFLPLYEAAFGGNGGRGDVGKLLAMYDEQRGVRLEKLEQTGEALKIALSEVDRQWDAQQSYARRLPELWQGPAAAAALDMLGKQSVLADEDRQHARAAMTVIADMASSLRSAVAAKAFATRELLEGPVGGSKAVAIDGKTPEEVKVIVDVHNAREWIDADQVRELGRIFPALAVPEDKINKSVLGFINSDSRNLLTGAYGDRVRSVTEEWLTKTFKPDFDRKLASYVDVCAEVDRLFTDQYKNLTDALAQVSEQSYPRPEGPSKPQPGTPVDQDKPQVTSAPGPPGAPAATVPASTAPSTVPAWTTPDSPTTPSTPSAPSVPTAPALRMPALDGLAALSQVAREFVPVATGLGQAVEQGVSALSGIIKSGVDDAIEKLVHSADPQRAEAEDRSEEARNEKFHAEAEFDIGGQHVKFEMGPDGRLALLLSDATGAERQFTLELNEHGIPVISTTEPEADNAEPSAPEALTPESRNEESPVPESQEDEKAPPPGSEPDAGDGRPGLPSGTLPGTRREEDGEHYPKPMPEQGEAEPDAPVDSGAELAEAGPLDAGFAEAGPL